MEGYKVALVPRGAGIRFWLRLLVSSRAAHKSIDFAAFCLPLASPSLCDMQRSETFHRDRSRRATRDIHSVTCPHYPVEAFTNCGPRTHNPANVWASQQISGPNSEAGMLEGRVPRHGRNGRSKKELRKKIKKNKQRNLFMYPFVYIYIYMCVCVCVRACVCVSIAITSNSSAIVSNNLRLFVIQNRWFRIFASHYL
jgi:hypothetical protein